MQGLEACEHFNFPYIQREVKTRTLHTPPFVSQGKKGWGGRKFRPRLRLT